MARQGEGGFDPCFVGCEEGGIDAVGGGRGGQRGEGGWAGGGPRPAGGFDGVIEWEGSGWGEGDGIEPEDRAGGGEGATAALRPSHGVGAGGHGEQALALRVGGRRGGHSDAVQRESVLFVAGTVGLGPQLHAEAEEAGAGDIGFDPWITVGGVFASADGIIAFAVERWRCFESEPRGGGGGAKDEIRGIGGFGQRHGRERGGAELGESSISGDAHRVGTGGGDNEG